MPKINRLPKSREHTKCCNVHGPRRECIYMYMWKIVECMSTYIFAETIALRSLSSLRSLT